MTHPELIEAIATAARTQNLSGYRLAQITGISEAQISRVFRGLHSPSLDMVLKLCEAVGVKLKIVNQGEMPAK
jgi:transcriptional regulator with XRE-family HTH domain